MIYIKIKLLHTVLATLSIAGFVLRGYWMLRDSPWLEHRMTRTLPHVNDTLFFLAGAWMVWLLAVNPFTQPWLITKFVGLGVYVLLGTVALRRGKTRETRTVALVGAIAVYAYVVGVALSKSPLGWLAL